MAYTTTPVANRMGFNRGWQNQKILWNTNLSEKVLLIYLKSYLLLKEYFRYHQINLLAFNIQSLLHNTKHLNIFIYKHLPFIRRKHRPFYFKWELSKHGVIEVLHKINNRKLSKNKKYGSNFVQYSHNRINFQQKFVKLRKIKKYIQLDEFNFFIAKFKKIKWFHYKIWHKRFLLPLIAKNWKFNISKKQYYNKKWLFLTSKKYNTFKSIVSLINYFILPTKVTFLPKQSKIMKKRFQNKKIANTNLILIRRLRVKNKQAKFSKLFKNIKFKPNLKLISSLKNSKIFRLNSSVNTSKPNNIQNIFKLKYILEMYLRKKMQFSIFVKIHQISDNVSNFRIHQKVKLKPRLKRAAEGSFFKRLLWAFLNIQRYMLVQLIADLIAIEITSHHKHKRTLRSINSLFNEVHPKHILGYKFLLDGKINGRMKTNLQVFKFKNKDTIPIQEFNKRVLYALSVARTYTGLFGIHVWLYY